MDIKEFAALKVGDEIDVFTPGTTEASRGTIAEVVSRGVRVSWSSASMTFTVTADSTAWMQWTKVEKPIADQPTQV